MIGHHLAAGLLRLGVAAFAPALDRQRRGGGDHAGTRRLAGREAHVLGTAVAVVLGIGPGRGVLERGRAEAEAGPGPHVDRDRHRRRQVGGQRQLRDLAAMGGDADLAAVEAGVVERGEDAAVVPFGLCKQAGAAGGRFLAIAPEVRGVADRGGEPVVLGLDREGDRVGQRIDDLDLGIVLGAAPEADAEDLEGEGGGGTSQTAADEQRGQRKPVP